MEILQNDIFGKKHQTKEEKPKKSMPQAKEFVNVTLQNGLNELAASNDAMLIHRVLQRKLIYAGLRSINQKSAFLKILKNELEIKTGKKDPVSAVRDSLLEFFAKQR